MCALLPRIETRTRLVLVIHHRDHRKPTNTGRLAAECLPNSEVVIRGQEVSATPAFERSTESQWLLLFPSEDAVPLTQFADSPRRVTLVVPDGSWRQASKVRARVGGLRDVPCVSLPDDAPTRYRLRTERRPGGLATLEAIARAMGILEGAHVREALESVLETMVERTLWARGAIGASGPSAPSAG